jgi:hypothetical protein
MRSAASSLFVSNRTGGEGNEEHEDGALWVSVANGRRDGGEPFLRVALLSMNTLPLSQLYFTDVEFILDNFVVMERSGESSVESWPSRRGAAYKPTVRAPTKAPVTN